MLLERKMLILCDTRLKNNVLMNCIVIIVNLKSIFYCIIVIDFSQILLYSALYSKFSSIIRQVYTYISLLVIFCIIMYVTNKNDVFCGKYDSTYISARHWIKLISTHQVQTFRHQLLTLVFFPTCMNFFPNLNIE